jgi:signal transduction histidine kinase
VGSEESELASAFPQALSQIEQTTASGSEYQHSREIDVSVDVPNGVGRSRAARELALFRVMQEALRNVHQSGRKKAGVRLFRDARAIVLEVTDDAGEMPMDGRPLRPGTSGDEVAGMCERVKIPAGGRLTVCRVDSRTTVRAAIPSRVDEAHAT